MRSTVSNDITDNSYEEDRTLVIEPTTAMRSTVY